MSDKYKLTGEYITLSKETGRLIREQILIKSGRTLRYDYTKEKFNMDCHCFLDNKAYADLNIQLYSQGFLYMYINTSMTFRHPRGS